VSRHRKRGGRASDAARPGSDSRRDDGRDEGDDTDGQALAARHRRFGWWSLLLFLLLGLFLESLHAFKVEWYLEAANATRRHMWTLAHAHGTLLAVLNLVLAGTIRQAPAWSPERRRLASACLLGAAGLMPLGFFLGGLVTHDGDPGIGIALVPVGAILLLTAVFLAARIK